MASEIKRNSGEVNSPAVLPEAILTPKVDAKEVKESSSPPTVLDDPNSIETPGCYECPIMYDLMTNPYVAADGISYEKSAIEEWIEGGHRYSAKTGEKLAHTLLIPNHNLREAIQDFLRKRPTLASVKRLEQENRSAEDERKGLALAIQMREEQWAAKIAAKEMTAAKAAANVASFFGGRPIRRASQEELGHAVYQFFVDTRAYLETRGDKALNENAPASIVGGVVSSFAKGGDHYEKLLVNPEGESVVRDIAPFIQKYVTDHPELRQLTEHGDFARTLKNILYSGNHESLREMYAGEYKPPAKTSTSSAITSSSVDSMEAIVPTPPSV